MTPVVSISSLSGGLHELKIKGQWAHPHWVAHLFSGLASQQISVVSGKASQKLSQDWEATFHLDFSRSTQKPEALDYVDLAHTRTGAVEMSSLKLGSFQISRRMDASLEVRLNGPDQVGLLGQLLTRLSLLGLFPIDLQISTAHGYVEDRIVFTGILGTVPSEVVEVSLENMLRGFAGA
jgi:hypothetical protein